MVDDDDWPCHIARKRMAEAYHDSPAALVGLGATLMAQAADDLHQSDPARLYRRFLTWTHCGGHPCRVCGRAGHDAAPGIPLRLVPCEVATKVQASGASA